MKEEPAQKTLAERIWKRLGSGRGQVVSVLAF